MPLDDRCRRVIEDFREWIESAVSGLLGVGDFIRYDVRDTSVLVTRWPMGRHLWYEVSVRPFLPQVRAGIMTDDVYRSRDFRRMIDGTGDTMVEFMVQAFSEVGLDWIDPPVEHYCEDGSRYYYSVPMDIRALDQLAEGALRDKVLKILSGFGHAFLGLAI